MIRKFTATIILVCLGLLALNCKWSKSENKENGLVIYLSGVLLRNNEPAQLNDLLQEGDVITTKKSTLAVIQFSKGSLIVLRDESELEITTLKREKDERQKLVLTQRKGNMFGNSLSAKNTDYSVITPTMTAHLSQSSAESNVTEEGRSELKLLKGKASVVPDRAKLGDKAKEIILKPNRKITASENSGVSKPQKLSKKEKKLLKALNKVKTIAPEEKTESVKPEDIGITTKVVQIVSKSPKKYTLKDIRKKYGKINKIVTKSGKIYIGSFRQKKGKISIYTLDGLFVILPQEIKKVSDY